MASEDETTAAATQAQGKPWDDDPDIGRWKMEKFDPSWNKGGMLEVSSFFTRFPRYKEKYLQEAWPIVQGALRDFGITCELNLVEECLTVSTTRKTRDPYIIIKARDLIELLARGVPAPQAIKILDDEMTCDIIKISNIIRNKETTHLQERFVRRRRRILGPNLSTRRAIEILTGCYILVQGGTVAAIGSSNGRGLKQVRRIVEDCMTNIKHPMYHIKDLLIKRDQAKNAAVANESSDRFLPNCMKADVKQKNPGTKEKKPHAPSPPPQQPSKIDLELESDENKSAKKRQVKLDKQSEKVHGNKRKREAAFIPPKENTAGPSDSAIPTNNGNVENPKMGMALKKTTKGFSKSEAQESRPRKYCCDF